ncbi:hypothetical protein UYO_2949 [Lachnospiraceae bacterium JC7]|nr:hypothetical protein UYO_2949 [Lachnospiraceae bacterium JC7]
MDMKEAMKARHMVRKYTGRTIPADIVDRLNKRVRINNEQHGLFIRLMTNDKTAIPGVIRLILAKGVNNYFIMAGSDGADELCGYCGADLMLYAQTLGLNTWWVGGTYNRKGAQQKTEGAKPVGIIAVGYGQTQGIPHKTKTAEQVSSYAGEAPQWFKDGIEAALLAPTALAKQAFTISGTDNKVSISCDNGIFTGVDTGLVKYHFELGAGKDNFEWE